MPKSASECRHGSPACTDCASARYTATMALGDGTSRVIYAHQPDGNLIGALPAGSWFDAPNDGTIGRTDGGDPFEHAILRTPSGRLITIKRDPPVRKQRRRPCPSR